MKNSIILGLAVVLALSVSCQQGGKTVKLESNIDSVSYAIGILVGSNNVKQLETAPGGDGINDVLVFDGLEDFPGSSVYIYNRWGAKIYESADYRNDWNGSSVSDGTYYYILNISDGRSLTGFVTILNQK